jgi:signal transduction histidine kinase
MNQLISELLEKSQIEDGRLILKKEIILIEKIINSIIQEYTSIIEYKKQKILFDNPKKDLSIYADYERLYEIIENLISNAIKYSPIKGKINIIVNELINKEGKEFISLSVNDKGPGLTDEDKIKIFKKFQKLSARPTGDEISTGLGLYLTKQLVDLHNGNIKVVSRKGEGASFVVELPVS